MVWTARMIDGGGSLVNGAPVVPGALVAPTPVIVPASGQFTMSWDDPNTTETDYLVSIDGGPVIPKGPGAGSHVFSGLTDTDSHILRLDVTNGLTTVQGIPQTRTVGVASADTLAPRLAAIQASVANNPATFNLMVTQLDRERVGAGTSAHRMLTAGYLRGVIASPNDADLAAHTAWWFNQFDTSLAGADFNPPGGSAPRDNARSYLYEYQHLYIWDQTQNYLGATRRAALAAAIETWYDQWLAFYPTAPGGNESTFLPQDSDETAWMLTALTQWEQILPTAKANESAVRRARWQAAVESEYIAPGGIFDRGAWGESPSYDDETPKFYAYWDLLAKALGIPQAYPNYHKDLARWTMYTQMADLKGRVFYNDMNSLNGADYYTNANQFAFYAHNKLNIDNVLLSLAPTDEEYRALMWLGDTYDADSLVNNEEFYNYAYRVFAEDTVAEGSRVNPWADLNWPYHHKSGQLLTSRSSADRDASQMFFWLGRPWRVDHILWQMGSFELFDSDGAASPTSVPITMNAPNNRFGQDPSEPSPANTIYIESAGGNVYPGWQARRQDFNSAYGEPATIGHGGVDSAYAWASFDMTASYYIQNAAGSSQGIAEYANQVRRTHVWLPGSKFAVVHDRISLNPNQVADIGQANGYVRESMTLFRTEALAVANGNGFVKATAKGKDFIYKQVGDATTQTLLTESATGFAGLIPVAAQEKFQIQESITANEANLIHLLKYDDPGLANPTELDVTIITGGNSIVAHEADGDVFIFNTGLTPISSAIEVQLSGPTAGKNVYAVGFDTGTFFSVSNPSGNNVRVAPGSGANPVSDDGLTFGILVGSV